MEGVMHRLGRRVHTTLFNLYSGYCVLNGNLKLELGALSSDSCFVSNVVRNKQQKCNSVRSALQNILRHFYTRRWQPKERERERERVRLCLRGGRLKDWGKGMGRRERVGDRMKGKAPPSKVESKFFAPVVSKRQHLTNNCKQRFKSRSQK